MLSKIYEAVLAALQECLDWIWSFTGELISWCVESILAAWDPYTTLTQLVPNNNIIISKMNLVDLWIPLDVVFRCAEIYVLWLLGAMAIKWAIKVIPFIG